MQPRRKDIKKGLKGENCFQVHPSGVAQDGEIAFYTLPLLPMRLMMDFSLKVDLYTLV